MNLAEFARWVIENGAFEAVSLDGDQIQEKAEVCGLLVRTKYDPKTHGSCGGVCEEGDDWWVFTTAFKRELNRAACK